MRIFHELVLDEFLEDITPGFGLFLKIPWGPTMGNFETMRFIAIADRVSGTSVTLSLSLLETPDHTYKLNLLSTLLNGVTLVAGQTNTFSAAASATDPAGSYAYQLICNISGTTPKAHVRVWVTGRGRA